MKKLRIQELTLTSFARYGAFASMINPRAPRLGKEPIEFYRDMVLLDLGGRSLASFSVCRVMKRPPVVDVTEYHTACGEGILPLDTDILIHVGLATPNGEVPLDRIEIFRVPRGTMVSLRPGVWHHAPFAYRGKVANILIVLPERTYANDCRVVQIAKGKRLQIVGAV